MGGGVAQGPWLMGVNPNLDQRMSHMHFYNSKKIGLFFFFFSFLRCGFRGVISVEKKKS
jgi:hypothetical protein